MGKARKKPAKRSSVKNIKKKSMGSKKSPQIRKGGSLTVKLEREFWNSLTTLQNAASKGLVEFSKETKTLRRKLSKTFNKQGKELLKKKIIVTENTLQATKNAKQKFLALKKVLQKFERDWNKKQAQANKKAALRAAKARAKQKAKSSKKRLARKNPAKKQQTLTPQRPMAEGFGSMGGSSNPAPFGQSHLGGGQHPY